MYFKHLISFSRETCIRIHFFYTWGRGGGPSAWYHFQRGVKVIMTEHDAGGRGGQKWPKLAWCHLWTAPYKVLLFYCEYVHGQRSIVLPPCAYCREPSPRCTITDMSFINSVCRRSHWCILLEKDPPPFTCQKTSVLINVNPFTAKYLLANKTFFLSCKIYKMLWLSRVCWAM